MSRFNRGQRVVAVVALGAALSTIGGYITTLGDPLGEVGWVGYAPRSAAFAPTGLALDAVARLFVWLALVAIWVIGSVLLLRTPGEQQPPRGTA